MQGVRTLFTATMEVVQMEKKINEVINNQVGIGKMLIIIIISLIILILSLKSSLITVPNMII